MFVSIPFLSFLLFFLLAISTDAANLHDFSRTLPASLHTKLEHCRHLSNGPSIAFCHLIAAFNAEGPPPSPNASAILTNFTFSPCRYRSDGGHRMHRHATSPSSYMNKAFQAYLSMHRRCAASEFDSLTEIYNSGRIPRCRYVIWRLEYVGLGNRLVSLVSAFLYALVTQRVFIIDYPSWNRLFCDPFDGIPAQIPPEKPLNHSGAIKYTAFIDAGCNGSEGPKDPDLCKKVRILDTDINHASPARELELAACPTGIGRARNIPFVLIERSNQYFMPAFFLNPALEPLLDILFPERNPFHVISRLVLCPSDEIWGRVRHYADGALLANASRRIGVQIREFGSGYTAAFDANVAECVRRKAGFAPLKLLGATPAKVDHVSVYVSSLEQRHMLKLNESLAALTNETGKVPRLTWQRIDGQERHDVQHQQEALVDMWVLSLSDVLISTRRSTFGYVAQGLAGLVSYYISNSAGDVCVEGAGTDPCYHNPPMELSCEDGSRGGVGISIGELVNRSESVKGCLDLYGHGLQVVAEL